MCGLLFFSALPFIAASMITFPIVWYLSIRFGTQSNQRSSKKGHHLTSRTTYVSGGTGVKAGRDSILENDAGRIEIGLRPPAGRHATLDDTRGVSRCP